MIINSIKNLKLSILVGFVSIALSSCESDIDGIGQQFFEGATPNGTEKSYDIVTYNVSHNDTIRTDNQRLVEATLGAFDESVFGKQKASYITQVRLSSYSPDFGANAKVDSIVLEIKPELVKDSLVTTTDENYKYEGKDAKKVVNTYPISKYGKKKEMTINVDLVNDFLGSASSKIYSNKTVAVGQRLGSKAVAPRVSGITITPKEGGENLYYRDTAIRIPLNDGVDFFQKNIVDKSSASELKDAASFIRYFRGLKISVQDNDGYIMKFAPNDVALKMYYSSKSTTDSTTIHSVYSFDLGSENVHFNQIEYNRPSEFTSAMNSINKTEGDARLYMQGMGGPGVMMVIPKTAIENIRELYNKDKIGILSAKIRLYTDSNVWNNSYTKPQNMLVKYNNSNDFVDDMKVFQNLSNFSLIQGYDLDKNPSYYDINITQTLKNIIEKEAVSKDLELNVGHYLVNSRGVYINQNYNNRAYSPERIVFTGSNTAEANKPKLTIIYTQKK